MRKLLLLFLPLSFLIGSGTPAKIKYSCIPCGRDCDKVTRSNSGTCDDCGMEMVDRTTIKFPTIEADDICAYIVAHPGVVLLDCRTPEEFKGNGDPNYGSLNNAINIPIGELDLRVAELAQFKDREIVVYCSHSHRSPQVAYKLSIAGFKKVSNMNDGMSVLKQRSCAH